MKYVVYETDKPAIISLGPCWGNASFTTKREAEVYAYLWAYPVMRDIAEKIAPEMDVGKKYDYSMCEVPLWMHIEVEE